MYYLYVTTQDGRVVNAHWTAEKAVTFVSQLGATEFLVQAMTARLLVNRTVEIDTVEGLFQIEECVIEPPSEPMIEG